MGAEDSGVAWGQGTREELSRDSSGGRRKLPPPQRGFGICSDQVIKVWSEACALWVSFHFILLLKTKHVEHR